VKSAFQALMNADDETKSIHYKTRRAAPNQQFVSHITLDL